MNANKANNSHRFLLAKFNVDYIVQFRTPRRIRQALGDLSIPDPMVIDGSNPERDNERRMDDVYNRIVREIREQPRDNQNYAFRALSWIGYAARTLTVQELLVAISVEPNQYQLDDSDMIRFEDLLDVCNGLVIADGQDVRLVHFSVRNYLDRHQVLRGDAGETYRAIACSTYLSLDALKENHGDYLSLDPTGLERDFPFLYYAANKLTFHLSKVECRNYPETTSAVMKLLEKKGHRRVYCRARRRIGVPLDIPRLNLACAIGYEDAVRTLLGEGDVNVNADDSTIGLTSLSWAVLMGHEAVVNRLLGEDEVDLSCNGNMPLSLAIEQKRTGIVRLLLEKGVEVNVTYDGASQSDYRRMYCYSC